MALPGLLEILVVHHFKGEKTWARWVQNPQSAPWHHGTPRCWDGNDHPYGVLLYVNVNHLKYFEMVNYMKVIVISLILPPIAGGFGWYVKDSLFFPQLNSPV